MQCERLIKLIKSWYVSVKDETMAPARMITFMEKHVATCPACQEDPNVQDEIAKISELVFPEYKNPKPVLASSDEDSYDDDDEVDGESRTDTEDSEEENDEFDEFEDEFADDSDLNDDDEI